LELLEVPWIEERIDDCDPFFEPFDDPPFYFITWLDSSPKRQMANFRERVIQFRLSSELHAKMMSNSNLKLMVRCFLQRKDAPSSHVWPCGAQLSCNMQPVLIQSKSPHIKNSMDLPADITRACVPGTNVVKILHQIPQEPCIIIIQLLRKITAEELIKRKSDCRIEYQTSLAFGTFFPLSA
jgi:hypothetical protein